MAETYNNYQPEYSFDNRQYEDGQIDGQIDSQTQVGDFENGVDIRGMDYARDTRGRELDYSRDGGRGSDYGYDGGRGGGDRGGGYARDGIRGDDSNRFSEGYEENRGSSRDRERERDRSRRDRDGRRERRHPRDRDHERSRERRERRERDRSPSSRYDDSYSLDGSEGDSQSYRDRERDAREMREDRGGEKWMTDTPTNTVLLRGLPPQVDEKDIRAELMMFGAPVKDVRLMRRSTGASRGFAFVEFQNVTDAQRWMDQKQGALNMLNQYQVSMHYSTPRVGPEKFVQHKTDWTCSKCGVHNFKRRDYCFKCNISRDESDKTKDGDGFDQVGTNPCNTLIFRGLDALTTEESLDVALRLQTTLQSKNVRIIRDPVTNTSRGYGFCEMNSIQESTQVIDFLTRNNVPLEVDGKQVLTSYAKNTFSTVMATLNSTSQNPAWDYSSQQVAGAGQPGSEYYNQLYQAGVTTTTSPTTTALTSGTPGEYDQTYYDQATGQYYDSQSYEYSHYYSQYGQSGSHPLQTDSTNAAAAVAQAAIAQANAAKNYNKQTPGAKKAEPVVEQAAAQPAGNKEVLAYPAPDVSTYQFDKSSGYYYDPSTGLYYDANSQYFYNPQTQQFMYWDAEKSTYLPAPSQTELSFDGVEDKKDKKDKKEKVKIAKKIAKDMEKWAKSLNAQKEMMKEGTRKITINTGGIGGMRKEERESATADAGFAILEKTGEDKKLMPPPPLLGGGVKVAIPPPGSKPGLVASYGGDSDEEEDDDSQGAAMSSGRLDETKLVDWGKLACLLCKRQFQSKEILTKHMQFSDLHKQNLESLQRSKVGSEEKKEYRDRAKERRQKYGAPQPPEPRNRYQAPAVYEEPTKAGLGGENIGNKLMQKMGWSEGMGLGKKSQGIVDPIQAKRRVQNTGLGLSGSNVISEVGDSYKDAVKKTFFARYNEQD
ncbi:RNA-binding protein 5-like isoform X6 [Haliotis rufescens]|uniref:RNA-binding protein 5-like isoform X6 n=1 Tax=Haliotis rufescens TaxID=6454 RepID=UPI00201E7EC8|nr:RNA-binding protein 5-like isoform X6 [Haliotis rufescens]